jgi:hypothetical protein
VAWPASSVPGPAGAERPDAETASQTLEPRRQMLPPRFSPASEAVPLPAAHHLVPLSHAWRHPMSAPAVAVTAWRHAAQLWWHMVMGPQRRALQDSRRLRR